MKRWTILKRHIVIFLAICLFMFILRYYEIGCPILYFLKIPCPTCGVTRAVIAFFKLDFNASIYYHPLAIPLVCSVLLMLHLNRLKKKRIILVFVFTTLILNTVLYIYRLLCF